MLTEINKSICMRHYNEVLTEKNIEVIDEIYADEIRIGDSQTMPRSQFQP